MFQVFALPLSRTELFLYFQWVAYKNRDTRTITIHVNKTLSPFFMLNLPFLGEGSQHQALAFISQVMYRLQIYLKHIGEHIVTLD